MLKLYRASTNVSRSMETAFEHEQCSNNVVIVKRGKIDLDLELFGFFVSFFKEELLSRREDIQHYVKIIP